MEVVHRSRSRHPLVAIETFGQRRRGPRLEGPTAARTILLGQPVQDPFGLTGVKVLPTGRQVPRPCPIPFWSVDRRGIGLQR